MSVSKNIIKGQQQAVEYTNGNHSTDRRVKYVSKNIKLTIKEDVDIHESIDLTQQFKDPQGMFGLPGDIVTAQDLKDYWDEECEYDPSLQDFDTFEDWYYDTIGWFVPIDTECVKEDISNKDIKLVMKAAANVTDSEDLNSVLSSLLSIDKQMYKYYIEKERSNQYSPSYIGKCISDDLYDKLRRNLGEGIEDWEEDDDRRNDLGEWEFDGYVFDPYSHWTQIWNDVIAKEIDRYLNYVSNGSMSQEEMEDIIDTKIAYLRKDFSEFENVQKAVDKFYENGIDECLTESQSSKKYTGRTWKELINDIESNSDWIVDSVDRNSFGGPRGQRSNTILLYNRNRDGVFVGEVTKYSDGTYELMDYNISETNDWF